MGLLLTVAVGRAATNAPVKPSPRPPAAEAPAGDPVETAYRNLLAEDDAAQAEINRWLRATNAFRDRGVDFSNFTLNSKIEQRLAPVRKAYQDFVDLHPDHVRARLAFGSFLGDLGDHDAAVAQWEKARDLDPKNPAAWNNLADYYSRHAMPDKAFACLDEARKLNPTEVVYVRNLATLVFLERAAAQEHYHLTDEQAVLRRALELFRQARQGEPEDFPLATDLAQVFYYLKPEPKADPAEAKVAAAKLTDDALQAWQDARKLARTELEREAVGLHLARVCLAAGRRDQARAYLAEVKQPALVESRQALMAEIDPPAPAASPAAQAPAVPETKKGEP